MLCCAIEFANSLAGAREDFDWSPQAKDYSGDAQTHKAGLPEAELILTTLATGSGGWRRPTRPALIAG